MQKNGEAYKQRLKTSRQKYSAKIESLTKRYLPHHNEKLKMKYKEQIQLLKTRKEYLTAQQFSEEKEQLRLDCKIPTEELTEDGSLRMEASDGN